ncbi:MAG: flavin reductase family protein [Chloroflexota bacterium]|nr:flavin reductase family protein [Chloroflexota bacterium]
MIIDPETFERFNAVLTGVIVPRPIAFVSTISPDGEVNLAPYSFFNAVSYSTVVFSSSRNVGTKSKDTLRNIEETGEFVVNIVVDPIAEAMNATAAEYPEGVDEFEIAGLSHAPSQIVKPPRVAESPVNIECKLDQVVKIGSGDHEHGLVIGTILLMHVRDDVIDGHRIDQAKLRATGRMPGNMYCRTNDRFEMVRPVYDAEKSAAANR